MINALKKTIKTYIERGGAHVFSASLFTKISKFISSVIIVRILSPEEYGNIVYATALLNALRPFSGFGANHSVLRFGSIAKTNNEKKKLFTYSLTRGLGFSLLLTGAVLAFSGILTKKMPDSRIFLLICAFQLITFFPEVSLQSLFRILKRNKTFALLNMVQTGVNIIFAPLVAWLLGSSLYVLFNTISPLLTFAVVFFVILILSRQFDFKSIRDTTLPLKKSEFWKYGFYIGVGSIASQLQYSLDNIFIGNMISDSVAVAMYKIGTVIPFNLMFIPAAFMTTDFVYIAEKYKDRAHLLSYIKKYWILFGLLTTVLFVTLYFAREPVIKLLYGEEYILSAEYLKVFLFGLIATFMLRIPLGNLLAAVGKANWGVVISVITLGVNAVGNYFLITKFGVIGAAYATNIAYWVSGILALCMFLWYLKKLKKPH
jgi:O-antigen/teichoic acid export membrane protein